MCDSNVGFMFNFVSRACDISVVRKDQTRLTKCVWSLFLLVVAFVFCQAATPHIAVAQEAVPARKISKPKYTTKRIHDPNGTGRFYMGREIARVMGHEGIAWLERPEREQEEHLTLLVDSLKLTPEMVVADIGAGSGVISVRMAKAVAPTGKVLAVDIQKEMLRALEFKCKQLGVDNVVPVLGKPTSPNLDPESVDLVIMVDVYHEFYVPHEMLMEISKALKVGGRVAFVEYRKEDPTVPIKEVHKMTEAQVRLEAEQPEFQLKWIETNAVLPRQHIILFEKQAEASASEEPITPAAP